MGLSISSYFNQRVSSSTLSLFRFCFGFLMCFSLIRFWNKGWIEELYLDPSFHFSYYGFEWIKPIGEYTYVIFFICFISSLFVCIGFKYRFSIVVFFLSFLYIEMMDKTTYLNHYYFISVLSFLLIFLPAQASFSLDNLINRKRYKTIPKWTIDSIKLLISIVYIYAAIAKINSDWLIDAMPLKIWISSKHDFPFLGGALFQKEWFYYFMSWAGMLYDLFIPFLLFYTRTRLFGFFLVVIFHVLTKLLFPIGMFPYIMIFSAIIFFSPKFHDNIIAKISSLLHQIFSYYNFLQNYKINLINSYNIRKPIIWVLCCFFLFQFIIPFRYVLYPGELFWHEQGYRFSWRVMLVEKTGLANFKIVDSNNGSFFYVKNDNFLTPFQEKQMSFQPDMILEYAHYLGDYYSSSNDMDVQVFVDSYVSLNGRKSQRLIKENVDLYAEKTSFRNKKWITELSDEITGF